MAEMNTEYRGTYEYLVEEWWQKKPEIERKLLVAEANKLKYEERNFQQHPVTFITADGLKGVRDIPWVHAEVPRFIDLGVKPKQPGKSSSVRHYVFSREDSTLISKPYVLVYVEEVIHD